LHAGYESREHLYTSETQKIFIFWSIIKILNKVHFLTMPHETDHQMNRDEFINSNSVIHT